ncbi:glycosyl hydrolase family 88 [Neolewinella xylanilytica]|uniref:Glycosyl hydrolase family 88 n=1 Tax=Neolewinella xylanilytica TaxID=1514080 RepID=A0A2S6I1J2_9BACT|nr:glycoside hydrolase family 88 protein [Neolewinella xylanilytica]PPK85042.1 glycosyl hydrolase family 88 [Neolewinella xylanilytica]
MRIPREISFIALLLASLLVVSCSPTRSQDEPVEATAGLLDTIERNLELATAQYKLLRDSLPADQFPKTYHPDTKKYEFSDSGWWVSGFYPGTLLMLYQETGDEALLAEAERIMQVLEKEKNNTRTHDLGFMMYDSFGERYEMDPDEETRQILLKSAESLASRYEPTVGAIKSWDSREGDYLVIIDNMMNLELLYWASRETGDPKYADIATTHANTTMANHFRPDNSTYHVLNYNKDTGAVQEKKTAQGYADDSAWARGQAWGLYGYTATYRDTKDEKYLEQARKIADFILAHPNLPADKVPYWDFDAPDIPNALRDASAGAIMASALLELSEYVDDAEADRYVSTAETILRTLSSDEYLAKLGTNGGFLLKHSVGHIPQGTEVDVPLTYADFYFVEAMQRYKEWMQ